MRLRLWYVYKRFNGEISDPQDCGEMNFDTDWHDNWLQNLVNSGGEDDIIFYLSQETTDIQLDWE